MEHVRIVVIAVALLALTLGACGGGPGHGTSAALSLLGVDPVEGSSAGGDVVTILGTGFYSIADDIGAILFGLNPAPSFSVINDSAIQCTTPPGRMGNVNVTIVGKEDGGVLLTGGFRYVAPLLWIADGDSALLATLYTVDVDTGQVGTVGPIGHVLTGLAFAPDGTLYGVEDGNFNRLMVVDPTTGTATPTGLLEDEATGAKYDVRDITFVGDRLIGRTSAGEMVEIDKTYGYVTVLEDLTPLVAGEGIAAAGPDTVYVAPFEEDHALYVWDPVDLGTVAGPVVPQAMQGTVDSLAFDDGVLYALDADLNSTDPAVLYRIDPATGAATWIADLSVRARAVTGD